MSLAGADVFDRFHQQVEFRAARTQPLADLIRGQTADVLKKINAAKSQGNDLGRKGEFAGLHAGVDILKPMGQGHQRLQHHDAGRSFDRVESPHELIDGLLSVGVAFQQQ